MGLGYTFVVDGIVAEQAWKFSPRRIQELSKIFHRLADDPYQRSDQVTHNSSGREIHMKKFDRWIIFYWTDHGAKEVRIVGLQNK